MANQHLPAHQSRDRSAALSPAANRALNRRRKDYIARDVLDELAVSAEARRVLRRLDAADECVTEAFWRALRFAKSNETEVANSATGQYLLAVYLDMFIEIETDIISRGLPR